MRKFAGLQQPARPNRKIASAAFATAIVAGLVAAAPPAMADGTAKISAALAYLSELVDVAGFHDVDSATVPITGDVA